MQCVPLACLSVDPRQRAQPLGGKSVPNHAGSLLLSPCMCANNTDICAFGPRNYAAESATPSKAAAKAAAASSRQQASARPKALQESSNANSSSSSSYASRTGWYCRDDRNGWRPVIERQQQRLSHGQVPCAGSRGCSTSRHRALPLRQRRSRLQLAAHSKGSSSGGGGKCRVAAGCAGLKDVLGSIEEAGEGSGCSSETEAQPGRAAYLQRRQQQPFHHSPLVRR
jgi:hypothetical protein